MKKKIIGLLSTLLFTLFVGLSGSCYAVEVGQVQNFIYNSALINNPDYDKTLLDSWFTNSTAWSAAKTYIEAHRNDTIFNTLIINQGYNIYFLTRSVESTSQLTIRNINNNNSYDIRANGFTGIQFRYNDYSFINNNYTSTTFNTVSTSWTDANIYYSNQILYYGWSIPNSEMLEGDYYQNIIWQFDYPSGFKYTIANTTDWTYHGITQGYQINVGSVTDSQYIDNIQYRFGSWNGSEYVWGNFKTLYDYNRNGFINNYFSGSTTNNNGVLTTTFYIDTYNNGNNILQIVVRPDSPDLTTHYHYYYVLNNNTSIVGSVIYPANTFSGDYEQQYNQQEQTNNITGSVEDSADKVIETITDDSQVNSMLDETLSGDKIIRDIGFNYVVNPFENIIKNTLIGFTNALLGSGDETIDFTIYDNSYSIHSEDFNLPDGEFKSFFSLLCNAFVVYNICKYGFKLYEWINTGRIQNLVNEQNRHQYYLF